MIRSSSRAFRIGFVSAAFFLFLTSVARAQKPDAEKIYQHVKDNIIQIGNEKCVSEMSRAIALDNTQAEYYSYRGVYYSLLVKDKEALADLDQALKLDPRLVEALYSRQYIVARTDKLKAIADLKRIVEIDPKQSNAFGILATYYLK